MNTTYILHGGVSSKDATPSPDFYKKAIEQLNKNDVQILFVYFARPQTRWEVSFKNDLKTINSFQTDKDLDHIMASPEVDEFIEQLSSCDLIVLSGGRKGFLKEKLMKIEDLPEKLNGKVVIGISAGAHILSKYYYSTVAEEVREGLGLINCKVFCHYSEDKVKQFSSLDEFGSDLPVLTIEEEEYIKVDEEFGSETISDLI